MFAVRELARGGHLWIYLITKVNKRSNGSDIRWKSIPQMGPTVAETTFQKNRCGAKAEPICFQNS